ncbi:MAG: S8 family serine peptidase [Lachnospiraceae bacterium]|nr:S8 family serine peptidase [Lachnospiraceae bacterium]
MYRKGISIFLSAALLLVLPAGSAVPASASATIASSHKFQNTDSAQSIHSAADQVEGQVLVTLAAPEKTALTKEGQTSFDSEIQVEDTWDFGNAQPLGDSPAEKKFLSDKTMYISRVSSDSYSTEELMGELENQAYVVSIEPDYYQKKMAVSNDILSDSQWYLDGEGIFSSASEGIHYREAKNNAGADTPVIAVVDTGIDYTHEDLADRMWHNPYSSLPGRYGYDFGDNDSDPMDEDEDGHGTHCAGTIAAATDNEKGISGISGNARLMALKIFDSDGRVSNSTVVAAFNYIYQARQLGANVKAVNCSWGGGASSTSMKTLIDQMGNMGILFIFAAGNSGINHDYQSPYRQTCPYDIDSDYIVTVGASDLQDRPASYSDFGTASVDLFAPGTQIVSTVNQTSFSPALYPEETRDTLCSFYSSCPDDSVSLYTPEEVGKELDNMYYGSVYHSDLDYFNDSTDGSLCLDIKVPYRGDSIFSLYLDVTDLGLTPSNIYYVSYDLGVMETGEIGWEHFINRRTGNSGFVFYNDRIFLRLSSLTGNFHSISQLYFDNLAVSKANPDTASFGQYAVMTGTSMAAPIITGAVAAMAAQFPSDTATQRRERLLSCVRTSSYLSGYCQTSGILDMSKIASSKVTPISNTDDSKKISEKKVLIKKIKLNKKKATLRYKKKLKLKATVIPQKATNKKVKWTSSKKKYATVTQSGVVRAKKKGIGRTVKIYARAKDGSGIKAFCKVKIKKRKK